MENGKWKMENGRCKVNNVQLIRLSRICWLLFAFSIFYFPFSIPALAQSKATLERQKRENAKRIAAASRILQDVAGKKEATLGQLSAIKEEISSRQQMIASIQAELALLDRDLGAKAAKTRALIKELDALKKEYAAMVYAASKARVLDAWLYVFASESINQFFARINYMRHYAQERRSQAARIEAARAVLMGERKVLQNRKEEKAQLLAGYTQERVKLGALQTEQTRVADKLAQKEERLRTELARRAEADRRLERLIAEMVRREMRRAAEARRRADVRERRNASPESKKTEPVEDSPTTSGEAIPSSPETARLSASFAENKGRLGWPVSSGFITGKFGKQPHPILRGVYVENLGINLQTKAGERVTAVAPGEIGFVAQMPGVEGRIVSVIHGDYFTVYTNLERIAVKPGDKVKAHELLGQVAADADGVAELQFQVWHKDDRLNPEAWLVGRK